MKCYFLFNFKCILL